MNATLESPQAAQGQLRMLWGAIVFLGVAVLASGAALVWVQTRGHAEPVALSSPPASLPVVAVPPAAPIAAVTAPPPAIVINNHAAPERSQPSVRHAAAATRISETKPLARRTDEPVAALPAPAPVAIAPAAAVPPVVVQGVPVAAPAVTSAPSAVVVPVANAPQPLVCANCATVESVNAVTRTVATGGTGAVAGGVLGALVGNQIGKGSGRALGTIIGAIGGGLAGNAVEKQMKKETVFQVRVRMDDGSSRIVEQSSAPAIGSRINLDHLGSVASGARSANHSNGAGPSVYDAQRI